MMPWLRGREGLGVLDHAHVHEHLLEEARVDQVQDRVLDAARVLIDRHPRVRLARDRTASRRCADRCSGGSTRTSRRTCPSCRSRAAAGLPHFGHVDVHPVGSPLPAATPPSVGVKSTSSGSTTGRSSSGTGTSPHVAQWIDRDRRAPVALPADQPVADPEVLGVPAEALGLEPVGDHLHGLARRCAVERAAVHHRRRHAAYASVISAGSRPRPSGLITTRIGRSYLRANSKSRWSWAGTAMIAPVP